MPMPRDENGEPRVLDDKTTEAVLLLRTAQARFKSLNEEIAALTQVRDRAGVELNQAVRRVATILDILDTDT